MIPDRDAVRDGFECGLQYLVAKFRERIAQFRITMIGILICPGYLCVRYYGGSRTVRVFQQG